MNSFVKGQKFRLEYGNFWSMFVALDGSVEAKETLETHVATSWLIVINMYFQVSPSRLKLRIFISQNVIEKKRKKVAIIRDIKKIHV